MTKKGKTTHMAQAQPANENDASDWWGMRAAGWIWTQPIPRPQGDPLSITKYAENGSEAVDGAERLYRESDVRALVGNLRANPANALDGRGGEKTRAALDCAPEDNPSFARVPAKSSDAPGLTREVRDDLISRHLGAVSIATRLHCHRLIDALVPALRGLSEPPQTAAELEQGDCESACANCGKPASQAGNVISEYPEEGEWFCSTVCFEQHNILDCPHLTHSGHRHPAEAARLIAAEAALRALASSIACGGFDAEKASTEELERHIRKGLDQSREWGATALASNRERKVPLFWVRPRSDGGFDGPIPDERMEDVRRRSGAWVALVVADDAGGLLPPERVGE